MSGADQLRDAVEAGLGAGEVQRGVAVAIAAAGGGAGGDETPHDVQLSGEHGEVQRGLLERVGDVEARRRHRLVDDVTRERSQLLDDHYVQSAANMHTVLASSDHYL